MNNMNIREWVFGDRSVKEGEYKNYFFGLELKMLENELKYLDEFDNHKLILLNSPIVQFADGINMKINSVYILKDLPIVDLKLFDDETIYLYGIGRNPNIDTYPDCDILIKYLCFDEPKLKVKIFSNKSAVSLEQDVNEFLKKIDKKYTVVNQLQSSVLSSTQYSMEISIWYQKR